MGDVQGMTPERLLQLTELELAKKFAAFCDEHDITYYMVGGTFLGAVRHKGFIPWDDDMDFAMLREDYERFLTLCQVGQVPFEAHNYFINKADPNRHRYFTRIEDPAVQIKRSFAKIAETTSVWIDVFPLDGMPNKRIVRDLRKYYLLWRRATFRFSVFSTNVDIHKKNRPWIEKILIAAGRVLPVEKVFSFHKEIEKLDRALKKYPAAESEYVFLGMGGYKLKELYKKDVFGPGAIYEFEGVGFRGPKDKEGYLVQTYGDYMTPPPENARNWHMREKITVAPGVKEQWLRCEALPTDDPAAVSGEKQEGACIHMIEKMGGAIWIIDPHSDASQCARWAA